MLEEVVNSPTATAYDKGSAWSAYSHCCVCMAINDANPFHWVEARTALQVAKEEDPSLTAEANRAINQINGKINDILRDYDW